MWGPGSLQTLDQVLIGVGPETMSDPLTAGSVGKPRLPATSASHVCLPRQVLGPQQPLQYLTPDGGCVVCSFPNLRIGVRNQPGSLRTEDRYGVVAGPGKCFLLR